MVQTQRLTAEAMIAAPRPGPAVPNSAGTLALFTVSTHNFDDGKTVKEARVMNLIGDDAGESVQLWQDDKVTEAVWIPEQATSEVIYLKMEDKAVTRVLIANAEDPGKEHYTVGTIDAPVSTLKLKALADGSIAFVVAGAVGKDGKLFNPEAVKKRSTGRIYDTTDIRDWDQWFEPERFSLWYTTLRCQDGKWSLSGPLNNLVEDETIEAPVGMYDILGAHPNFDITDHGIVFASRELSMGRERQPFIVNNGYYVPLKSFTEAPESSPRKILTPDIGPGLVFNVRFTPDGKRIALLYFENEDWYNAKFFMADLSDLVASDILKGAVIAGDELDPPSMFEFAGSDSSILFVCERLGRVIVSSLSLTSSGATFKALTSSGSVSAFFPLTSSSWDKLLVTSSNFVDNGLWQIVDAHGLLPPTTVSSATRGGTKFGLKWDEMVEEFWVAGDDGSCVQSFLVKPMGFDKGKKYPYIFLPHGGPVSSWTDAWSSRWNMATFAEQGYVVVLPNIAGSTGFGNDFVKRVDNEWGGKAFTDGLSVLKHVESLPYLDQSKAVLAGASYSGYLVSWFMGQEIIKKFCCAIWHDGIFSIPTFNLQSDFIDPDATWGGRRGYIWSNYENLRKWDPATPERLQNWKHAPPTLVVHSEKDYRCPITEGIATFNTLHAQGVPCRFLTFPDEGHWVLKPENSRFWYEAVLGWMDRCVKGEVKRGDKKW